MALGAVLGSFLIWPAHQLVGGETLPGSLLVAAIALFAWVSAIRLLLTDTAARRLWIVWLAALGVLLLASGRDDAGRHIALALTGIFLLVRRYQPYRQLSSARRAILFLLAFPTLAVLAFGLDVRDDFSLAAAGWLHGLTFNLGRYALDSLRVFWILSLLHIFFRMRLHSWRLKPKLAVTALLIAIVPLLLVVLFGLLTMVSVVGGSRANRGRAILEDWAQIAASGVQLPPSHFAVACSVRAGRAQPRLAGRPPRELPVLLTALAREPAAESTTVPEPGGAAARDARSRQRSPWSPVDTTGYFVLGEELWLLRLRNAGSPVVAIDGYRVTEHSLDRLSRLLGSDAGIYSDPSLTITVAGDNIVSGRASDSTATTIDIRGRVDRRAAEVPTVAPGDRAPADRGFVIRYGAALLDAFRLSDGRFWPDRVILHLESTPGRLLAEYTRSENPLNRAVAWVLALLAGFFLVLEAFALFLGIRITGGITSAVAELRRGTLRIAGGDLQTRIALPNQDEFGQLADSFNEMTVAVRRGRAEAVARERLERELETARQIQQRLLPREIPAVPGYEIVGSSVPSRQVGGDYFDVLALAEDRVGIAIGDVSGKGMPAALLMSNLQAGLQGQVIHPGPISGIVGRMNDLLARSTDAHMFATFYYGVLDARAHSFTGVNAGHNPPIIHRVGGTVETLTAGGLVLGMLPGQDYQQETITLQPGDVLVLYTDGITEATAGPAAPAADAAAETDEDPDRMFGEGRLRQVIAAQAGHSAAALRQAILEAVGRHAAGAPPTDDITLVVIKRRAD